MTILMIISGEKDERLVFHVISLVFRVANFLLK